MNIYCTKCGAELIEGNHFCSECGTEVDSNINSSNDQQQNKKEQAEFAEETVSAEINNKNQPISRMKKITYSIVTIILISLLSAHYIITNFIDSDKKVIAIHNALIENNEQAFYDELTLPKKVNYERQSFIDYINDSNLDAFLSEMKTTAKQVQKDGTTRIVYHEDGERLFQISYKKYLFFYPTIEIMPFTTELVIETDLKNSKLSVANVEKKLEGKNVELGRFLPGYYNFTISTDVEPFTSEHTYEFFVRSSGNESTQSISIFSEDFMISLDGAELDSIVFINGESTNETISDLKEVGPIYGDKEITMFVEKETPGGEIARSYEEVASGGSSVYFDYPPNVSFVEKTPEEIAEETFDRDDLKQFIVNFRNDYESALNLKNFDLIEKYLKPKSAAYKEIEDLINSIGDDDVYFYEFLRTNIEDIKLTPKKATITTEEEFFFTDDQKNITLFERTTLYEISVNKDGDYKISKTKIKDTSKTRSN